MAQSIITVSYHLQFLGLSRYILFMLNLQVNLPEQEISAFCLRWNVTELALFGSVLRSDFTTTSDVDVMISFAPDAQISLFDMAQMQIELQAIFNRPVDILEKAGLRNPYRKQAILDSAQVIYAA